MSSAEVLFMTKFWPVTCWVMFLTDCTCKLFTSCHFACILLILTSIGWLLIRHVSLGINTMLGGLLIAVKSLSSAYWICPLPSTPWTMTSSSTGCTTPSVSVIRSFHGSQVSSPDIHRGSVSEASTRHTLWVSEQCFTSPPTQYRLYGIRFLRVKRPNQQYRST